MSTIVPQPFRRVTLWTTLLCLMVVALLAAACGGDTGTTSSAPSSSSSQPAASGSGSSSAPTTGAVMTITITEKTGSQDIYSFDPPTLSVKAGTTVKWVNNSDENHLLASNPSGIFDAKSVVARSGSSDNTFQMTFTQPGTYAYTSTLVQRIGDGAAHQGMSSSAQGTITVTP